MDIIDWIEQAVETLGWVFSYGNKANQNLLMSDMVDDRKYFLLDPVRTTEGVSEMGGDGEQTFSGSFMLLVKSDLDNVYHNQSELQDKNDGKYNKNIKPLKTELKAFKDVVDCSDYTRESWEIVDIVDALDINADGLLVTFTLKLTE